MFTYKDTSNPQYPRIRTHSPGVWNRTPGIWHEYTVADFGRYTRPIVEDTHFEPHDRSADQLLQKQRYISNI